MKIVIVGGGNAGCMTALHIGWFTRTAEDVEVELIYDPKIPPEPVGSATLLEYPELSETITLNLLKLCLETDIRALSKVSLL